MILTSSDENHFETNSISEDGSSCTGKEISLSLVVRTLDLHFRKIPRQVQ